MRNDPVTQHLLTDILFDDYLLFIKNKLGITLKRDHQELQKHIQSVCERNHHTPEYYLDLLKASSEDSSLLEQLISAITIGETYFFRDKAQMKALYDHVLPEVIRHKLKNNDKNIRVWSAGCSSGEELYSIIMMLAELLPDMKDWQCSFLGTDINVDVMRKGLSGRYTDWSMRAIPDSYLKKYFRSQGGHYYLSDEIKQFSTFEYLNLNSDCYPSLLNGTAMQDLIICRNVLIYFDVNHVKTILDRLSSCLTDKGYLLLGASDPLFVGATSIKNCDKNPSLFMKTNEEPAPPEKHPEIHVATVYPEKKMVVKKEKLNHRVSLDKIHELQEKSAWVDSLTLIEEGLRVNGTQVALLTAKATALANLGQLDEAVSACLSSIKQDAMNPETYFIYALVLSELKNNLEAESAFRKALYINPDFLVCRYQYGMFLLRHHRYSEGFRAMKNVLKHAKIACGTDKVPYAHDMTYSQFVSVLEQEMNLYKSNGMQESV